MAQQSSQAREWHSARMATVQCCMQCMGGRRGLAQGQPECMVSVADPCLGGEGASMSTCSFECFSWTYVNNQSFDP